MIYQCNKCHFLFERAGEVERCPDCGNQDIREADHAGKEEFKRLREEFSCRPVRADRQGECPDELR